MHIDQLSESRCAVYDWKLGTDHSDSHCKKKIEEILNGKLHFLCSVRKAKRNTLSQRFDLH